ncbi:hypothetical protein CIHG_01287 [Coccidioides immitis H538.4]|uniref:Uncharacterized protein n=1 Tax=Coccidioides immitis H538.4 TaxID=396776 RepID=A0A0J8RE49_COCIT|nr:hypothetical protein CIHG_01287 [Coccidioides immitis H538.4]
MELREKACCEEDVECKKVSMEHRVSIPENIATGWSKMVRSVESEHISFGIDWMIAMLLLFLRKSDIYGLS